jgi:hypothetical protein
VKRVVWSHLPRPIERLRFAALGTASVLLLAVTQVPRSAVADDFLFGSGLAVASVVDYDIISGGANVNVYGGESTATYQDQAASASAANVNVPLAGLLGALTVCSQAPPSAPLPAPAAADTSSNGNTAPVSSTGSAAGGAAGVQKASAKPGASASAEDDLGTTAIPSVVSVEGGSSTAEVTASPASNVRSAAAGAKIGEASVLNGALVLGSMRWDASQSVSGVDSRNDHRDTHTSFTISSVRVGPVQFPVASPSQLPSVVGSVNGLIAPFGLQVRIPEATYNAGSNQEILTPLTIALGGNSSVWGPLLAHVFNDPNIASVEAAVTGTLFDPNHCDELDGLLKSTGQLNVYYNLFGAAAPLVIGILGQALSSGEIDINLGGASASLDDTYYAPFDYGFASQPYGYDNGSSLVPAVPTTQSPGNFSSTFTANPGLDSLRAPSYPRPETSSSGPTSAMNAVTRCESSSPAGGGCWSGKATIGASVAAVALMLAFVADEVYRRRRTLRSQLGSGER